MEESNKFKLEEKKRNKYFILAVTVAVFLVFPLAYSILTYMDRLNFTERPQIFKERHDKILMKEKADVHVVFHWGEEAIWLGTNRAGSYEISLSIESLPGKVLGDGGVAAQGLSLMEGFVGKFHELSIKSGAQLFSGHYWVSLSGRPVGKSFHFRRFIRDLLPDILPYRPPLPEAFKFQGEVFLGQESILGFSKKLTRYNQEKKIRIKENLVDRLEKYHFFYETLLQLKTSYKKTVKGIKKSFWAKKFERSFAKINPALQSLILENRKKMKYFAKKNSFESNEYRLLADFGKGIDTLILEIILETKKKHSSKDIKRHLQKKYEIRINSLLKKTEIHLHKLQGLLDYLD